ncbi:MAG: hypothetical protein ACI8U4_001689 [Natronomonas sp.]|jgi:hypothetical protein
MADDWLFHLPAFFQRVDAAGAQPVLETVAGQFGGVLYHHRGVRVPGHDATFVAREESVELVVDGVGDRAGWVRFDADRSWDAFFAQPPDDVPYFAWMCDAEFEADEAGEFTTKAEAVGLGRFSFGLYLQPPTAWADLEERASETEAPCFVYRPSGRTLVPEGPLDDYEEVVPPELLGETPPDHLGIAEADLGVEN